MKDQTHFAIGPDLIKIDNVGRVHANREVLSIKIYACNEEPMVQYNFFDRKDKFDSAIAQLKTILNVRETITV